MCSFGVDWSIDGKNRVKIICSNMSNSLIDILTRNGFIGNNYLDSSDNHNGTVVSFQRFKHNQDSAFNGYIKENFSQNQTFLNIVYCLEKNN